MAFGPLPSGEAHLWYAEQEHLTNALATRYLELLSDAERQRYARFAVPRAAAEFLLGRGLLRTTLGAYLGMSPRAVELRLGEHGKPELAASAGELADLSFNLAHSHGMVACLVARGCSVGVDVEHASRELEVVPLARRFFHPAESADVERLDAAAQRRRFFQYWTLKEACLKALGTGLSQPLDRFRFEIDADGVPRLGPGADDPLTWQVAQYELAADYLLALAIRRDPGAGERRVVLRRALPPAEAPSL